MPNISQQSLQNTSQYPGINQQLPQQNTSQHPGISQQLSPNTSQYAITANQQPQNTGQPSSINQLVSPQNPLQLQLHQLLQLQSILSPDQLKQIMLLQHPPVQQPAEASADAQKPQNGRICKKKNCTFCTAPNCGVCGNCLHPERRNKCIRRYGTYLPTALKLPIDR